MTFDKNQAAEEASRIFRGENNSPTLQDLLELGKILQRTNKLDDARRILEKALLSFASTMEPAQAIGLIRDLIVCTYKDPDLPADTRLSAAEQMLLSLLKSTTQENATPLQSAVSRYAPVLDNYPNIKQDLLGVAGAVEKRRWEIYGLRVHLVRSYQYYLKGHEMGPENDQGYNGINLAFVLDLLSEQEEGELDQGKSARDKALQVRNEIIQALDPTRLGEAEDDATKPETGIANLSWWLLVTLGEAYLGIGDYDQAEQWMKQAADMKNTLAQNEDQLKHIAPWQLESVARQIVRVAQIQEFRNGVAKKNVDTTPSWRVVLALLGGDANAARAAQSFLFGKVGLALSGGGFRASLFHIGVLAKLAELDVLKHVEVLSCVSGGSILGAYYYLELRKLLQEVSDSAITRQHYIDLVERVRKGFCAGVRRNIRLRMLLGWSSNFRVLTSRKSSTSDRLALLYESELYSNILDDEHKKPRYLANLKIVPGSKQSQPSAPVPDFNPKYENWARENKVPAMILNATSLNTCHNWQFTASFMGEPPARSIDAEIDANHRMRRMYHSEAPPPFRRRPEDTNTTTGVRLGEAVAASACVPGLFTPILLEDLYGELGDDKTGYLKRLVDGGNYDNQGIASLREQDCSVLMISDACGQTGISVEPEASHFGVMSRANNILMARSREVQYQLLSALKDSGAIRGLMYLHLKKGLQAQVIDWTGCQDSSDYINQPSTTDYGVRTDVQRLLAAVRTDLDSFSWLESDALMLSGYLMAGSELTKCLSDLPTSSEPPVSWDFLKLQSSMTSVEEKKEDATLHDLKTSLKAAENLTFKPFMLYPCLRWIAMFMGCLLSILLIRAVLAHWSSSIPGVPKAGEIIAVAFFAVLALIAVREFILVRLLNYRNSYLQIIGALFMCIFGWIIFYPYLKLIDPLYINWRSEYRKS